MSVKTKTRIYQRKTKSGKEQLLSRQILCAYRKMPDYLRKSGISENDACLQTGFHFSVSAICFDIFQNFCDFFFKSRKFA